MKNHTRKNERIKVGSVILSHGAFVPKDGNKSRPTDSTQKVRGI